MLNELGTLKIVQSVMNNLTFKLELHLSITVRGYLYRKLCGQDGN